LRVFVAGASGAIGTALVPLLVRAGHEVTGTTRRPHRAERLRGLGALPVVVDALDRAALVAAVMQRRPDVVIHQLTDLASIVPGGPFPHEVLEANARVRIEGTANLVAAAIEAGARRLIAQSIAWLPGPADEPLPLLPGAGVTERGVHALETQVVGDARFDGIVLRYGRLYGPLTWTLEPPVPPTVSVGAAARAAALAVTAGAPGVYNIVDDGGPVSNERARRALGWEPG
jgi:nucleoside-diphosphate-sugar epimerase